MDTIGNLMGLSRQAHEYFGDKKQFKAWLMDRHTEYLKTELPYVYRGAFKDPIFKEFANKFGLY